MDAESLVSEHFAESVATKQAAANVLAPYVANDVARGKQRMIEPRSLSEVMDELLDVAVDDPEPQEVVRFLGSCARREI